MSSRHIAVSTLELEGFECSVLPIDFTTSPDLFSNREDSASYVLGFRSHSRTQASSFLSQPTATAHNSIPPYSAGSSRIRNMRSKPLEKNSSQ